MSNVALRLSSFALMLVLSACASPHLKYKSVDEEAVRQRKYGELAFHLRTTNIFLSKQSSDDDNKSAKSARPAELCTGGNPTTALCLSSLQVAAVEANGQQLYLAINGNRDPLAKTRLTATTFDGDDFNPKSVTVVFSDNTAKVLSAGATGAGTGAALGPWGAAGGAVFAMAGQALSTYSTREHIAGLPGPDPSSIKNLLCASDHDENVRTLQQKLSLQVPVTISLDDALKDDPKGDAKCWHLLPTSVAYASVMSDTDPNAAKNTPPPSGWLYRVFLDANDLTKLTSEGAAEPEAFFKDADETPRTDFPYNPCQTAYLDLAWWSDAASASGDSFHVQRYVLKVANPNLVMGAQLPKSGSITLGTVCGADVQPAAYTGSTLSDDATALENLAAALAKAQGSGSSSTKGSKGKSGSSSH
jgi:hypothetical protein